MDILFSCYSSILVDMLRLDIAIVLHGGVQCFFFVAVFFYLDGLHVLMKLELLELVIT